MLGERGSPLAPGALEDIQNIQIGCSVALKSSNWLSINTTPQNFENVLRFGRGAVIFSQTYHKYISSLCRPPPLGLLGDILPAPPLTHSPVSRPLIGQLRPLPASDWSSWASVSQLWLRHQRMEGETPCEEINKEVEN